MDAEIGTAADIMYPRMRAMENTNRIYGTGARYLQVSHLSFSLPPNRVPLSSSSLTPSRHLPLFFCSIGGS